MSRQSKKREKRSVAGATAKRREKAGQGFSDMFNFPKGTETFGIDSSGVKRIDIVPYVVGKGNPNAEDGAFYWERTFFAHRGIGVNNDWVVCPARTVKKPCPICELAAKMQKDADADEDAVKALSPSKRMLVNVRDLKKDPDKVKVWHVSHWYFGKALDEALASAYEDHEDNMDNFCDPEGGHYLKCMAETGWEGQGYQIARVDFVPRKEDLTDEILEKAVCLDDALNIKSYEEIKEMLYAGEDEDEKPAKKSKSKSDDDDEDDEDEDEKPAKKSKSKSKSKDDDDEDDDEEADDDDDDDDEDDDDDDDEEADDDDEEADDEDDEDEKPAKKPKPKPKSKSKSKSKLDDDEEEEEDEEDDDTEDEDDDWDDDEDEKPKKGKK